MGNALGGVGLGVIADPQPAKTVPSELSQIGASMTDPTALALQGFQEAEANKPTKEEVRAAEQSKATALEEYRRKGADWETNSRAMMDEYAKSAQAYSDKAKQGLPQRQAIPAPPPVGISSYLSPTQNEDPATTVAKFLQTISLFATMAGGGKTGARASLSAFTGMLEGWGEGNRYKADRLYKTWKDSTEAMFRSFDDEMRAYNSIMVAERVPLEAKFRALDLAAYNHKNEMAQAEFRVNEADKAWDAIQKRYAARERALENFTKIVAMKQVADQTHELAKQKQEENFSTKMIQLDLQRQRNEIMRLATGGEATDAATLDRLADERINGAPWTELIRGWGPRAQAKQEAIDKRVDEKLAAEGADPGTSRLVRQRILQADTKSAETLARQQASWTAFEKAFPPAVENMIRIAKKIDGRSGMPVVDKWLLKARQDYMGDEDVKALDQAMDVVAMEYARVVKRQGISDVATQNRAKAMFNLGATPEQFRRVVDETLMPDIEFARRGFEAAKQGIITSMKTGQKALTTPPSATAPTTPGAGAKTRTLTVNGKTVTVTEE